MNAKKVLLVLGIAIMLVGIPVGIVLYSSPTGFSLGAKDANKPENISATVLSSQSVSITWITGKTVQGGVGYGLSTDSMTLFTAESGPTVNHAVTLEGLAPGKTYYYVVKINNQTYDNNGSPYTFITSGSQTVTPTLTPALSTPTESGFQSAFGTSDPVYDLNKDGIVNTLDLEIFRQGIK